MTAEKTVGQHRRAGRHETPSRIPRMPEGLRSVIRIGGTALLVAGIAIGANFVSRGATLAMVEGAWRYGVEHEHLIPANEQCANPPTVLEQMDGLGRDMKPSEAEALYGCVAVPTVVVL